jgi:alpha-tubulin suppressor-like RCC1 family protein
MKRYSIIILMVISATISQAQCWSSISTCDGYAFGIQKDSSLWMWGTADAFGFGDSIYDNVIKTPKQYHPGKWIAISSDVRECLLIRADGTLWGFGDNVKSNLGDPNPSHGFLSKLTQIGTDNDWVKIDVNSYSSFAIKKNGTLWATGEDHDGALGLGVPSYTVQYGFKQVGVDTDWVNIYSGGNITYAIKNNGTMWHWGNYHWFGDSTFVNVNVPKQMGTDTNWVTIIANSGSLNAIKKNGTLWAWGDNSDLVSGTFGGFAPLSTYYKPFQIGRDSNWVNLMNKENVSFALKKDGSLWACGRNNYAQFGDGTTRDTSIFIQVGLGNKWKSAKTTYFSTIAISATGELFTWGYNPKYALGIGNYKDSIAYSPNMVGNFCAPLAINTIANIGSSFSMFPNPAQTFLHIKIVTENNSKSQDLKIYDVFGKMVYYKNINAREAILEVPLYNFSKGIYFVAYQNVFKKLVIE